MTEIILYKISVTARRIKSLGVTDFGGYAPGPIAPREGVGGYKPDEIGI